MRYRRLTWNILQMASDKPAQPICNTRHSLSGNTGRRGSSKQLPETKGGSLRHVESFEYPIRKHLPINRSYELLLVPFAIIIPNEVAHFQL